MPIKGSESPQFPDVPQGLEVTARRIDPAMEAAQRAAEMQYSQRQGGQWANLPNGQMLRVAHVAPHYETSEESIREARMLSNPEWMLRNPKPNFQGGSPRYQWRVYKGLGTEQQRMSNETARDARAGRIRPVDKTEVDSGSPFALYDHFELETEITAGSMKLYEVMDPKLAYSKYKAPVDRGIQNVMNLPATVASHPETHTQRMGIDVKQADVKQGG